MVYRCVMIKTSTSATVLLLVLTSLCSDLWADELAQQRSAYLAAEQIIKKGNSDTLADNLQPLKNYPLYPKLMQLGLQKNFGNHAVIAEFLAQYKDSRYAKILQQSWYDYLIEQQQWQTLVKYYHKTDDLSRQCQYHWALFNLQQATAALEWMQKTWPQHVSLPIQCAALSREFLYSPLKQSDLLWQKFERALLAQQPDTARKLLQHFDDSQQEIAKLWLKLYKRPQKTQNFASWPKSDYNGWVFANGVERLARKKLSIAVKLWDNNKQQFTLDHHRRQRVEKNLAIALAKKGDKSAYQRLNQLVYADQETREWRVQAALVGQNWRQVFAAVERLNSQEKRKPRWQYWRARAYWELGEKKAAKRLFTHLAKNRSYYGFIAADYAGHDYQLHDLLFNQDFSKLDLFMQQPQFQAVNELLVLKRKQESLEQWMFAVKQLSPWKIPVAINYALQQGWKKHAALAIKYADYMNNISQYFPLYYRSRVMAQAKRRKIDPAVIFAIIRQESAFNADAVSPVGALGLMQIMPKTGEYIAGRLKEPWDSTQALFNPDTNVRYGAFYYRRMLQQFDQHFALAAAAYNAGPHRVKRWLPKDQPMAADIWIEMIPFDETRNYVKSVLSYALIYQQQLNGDALSMLGFLRKVQPQ